MRLLISALAALAVLGTGCVIVPRGHLRQGVAAERCPPGHQWSDGSCRERGHGREKRHHDD
jgi:hypothetical protein